MFEPINFENLNEADVREEVLAPLIRKLGYRSGTGHNVIREQSLRYPRAFIGRKNSKRDPILRGVADYILEAGSSVRWVIEAKAPDANIDVDTIEQAYTYANHPEVRAVYFALSNGKKFVVFRTNRGPGSKSILDFSYEELENNYRTIADLLSPDSILRDYPNIEPDFGNPIGEGLRSVVRIANGVFCYDRSSVNMPALFELQTSISGGAIERDENGRLVAFLSTIAPTRSVQKLNQRLGLTSFEMYSNDCYISSDSQAPTVFHRDEAVTFPAGETLLDFNSWQEVTLPMNITCRVTTKAFGHLEKNLYCGAFSQIIDVQNSYQNVRFDGRYEIFIA